MLRDATIRNCFRCHGSVSFSDFSCFAGPLFRAPGDLGRSRWRAQRKVTREWGKSVEVFYIRSTEMSIARIVKINSPHKQALPRFFVVQTTAQNSGITLRS